MDVDKFLQMIGWHDKPDGPATHDPIPNNASYEDVPSLDDVAKCLCLICEQPLKGGAIQTVSIRWETGFLRSYFYRVHKSCSENRGKNAYNKAWRLIEEHAMEKKASS